jgi:hypothetical protein
MVTAAFVCADGMPIELPASSDLLTVLSLQVEPTTAIEFWRAGRRFVRPPDGCLLLRVDCCYRAYSVSGTVPTPEQLFPSARVQDKTQL